MRSKYKADILRAMEYAPSESIDLSQQGPRSGSDLAALPHDFALHHNPDRSVLENMRNAIVVARPSDLEQLVTEFFDLDDKAIGRREGKQAAQHEKEHGIAARKLGAAACYYGILLTKTETLYRPTPFTFVYNLRTTKLGIGALTAYPKRLSPNDEEDLKTIGYSGGVQEVGALIQEHNAKARRDLSKSTLPLPLSYKASGRRLFV